MQPVHIMWWFSPFIQACDFLDSFCLETQNLEGPIPKKLDGAFYPGLDHFADPMPSPEGWVKTYH
jgi:hypothetical protein